MQTVGNLVRLCKSCPFIKEQALVPLALHNLRGSVLLLPWETAWMASGEPGVKTE